MIPRTSDARCTAERRRPRSPRHRLDGVRLAADDRFRLGEARFSKGRTARGPRSARAQRLSAAVFVVPRTYGRSSRSGVRPWEEGELSELRSALDGLAEVGPGELSDDALLDLVGELSTATNRIASALTSAVR